MKRSLIPCLAAVLVSISVFAVPAGTNDEITARLQPFGSVCRTGEDCSAAVANTSSGARSGQEIYDQFCFACHAAGVGGAPILGDTAAWSPRTAKGMDALMATTLSGLNAMPPKGTCMACSDEELSTVVSYMIDQAK